MTSPDDSWRKRRLACVAQETGSCPPLASRCAVPRVIILVCQSRSDHGICTLLAVFSSMVRLVGNSQIAPLRRKYLLATTHVSVAVAASGRARVTFMVKHCCISLTTSCWCELELATIKWSTCMEMNTLRARSTKSVGCASERVRPSRDVRTSAKLWKSRDASLKVCLVLG